MAPRRTALPQPDLGPVIRRPVTTSHSTRARTQKRRRDVFMFLLAAMAISLLLSFVVSVMLLVHLAFDVAFVAYVGMLIRMRNAAAEREMKVHFLPGAVGHNGSYESLLLRRSAN
jgi:Flp pilus assembly protein TadB